MGIKAYFDTIKTLAHGSISTSYAAVGTVTSLPAHAFRIINNTDGDMLFSTDGSTDMLFVPHGSFVLYDVSSNKDYPDQKLFIPAQLQFYVKYSSSPSTGAVWIELLYSN